MIIPYVKVKHISHLVLTYVCSMCSGALDWFAYVHRIAHRDC